MPHFTKCSHDPAFRNIVYNRNIIINLTQFIFKFNNYVIYLPIYILHKLVSYSRYTYIREYLISKITD